MLLSLPLIIVGLGFAGIALRRTRA
jgi:hypothetical protein